MVRAWLWKLVMSSVGAYTGRIKEGRQECTQRGVETDRHGVTAAESRRPTSEHSFAQDDASCQEEYSGRCSQAGSQVAHRQHTHQRRARCCAWSVRSITGTIHTSIVVC